MPTVKQEGELSSTFLREKQLYKSFGILLYKRFVYSPHLFIYSITYIYQYGLIGICFILWVIILYYTIYLAVEIFPPLTIGISFCWLLCSFYIPSPLFVYCSFFLSIYLLSDSCYIFPAQP